MISYSVKPLNGGWLLRFTSIFAVHESWYPDLDSAWANVPAGKVVLVE